MIPQISIFDNTEVYDNLGELEKIKLVLDNMPDENLLASIQKEKDIRGHKGILLEALLNIKHTSNTELQKKHKNKNL